MTTNAAEVLLADHDPQHVAFVCGTDSITFAELTDAVGRAAAAWQARGLARGDRVAIKLPDSIDWVTAYLGAIWAGGVAVGVNPRIPEGDWQYIMQEGDFRFVLSVERDDADGTLPDRVISAQEFRADLTSRQAIDAMAMQPDEPCFWCHSSGSSGRPKAVMHAHRFASQVERVAVDLLGINGHDRIFASSKLFFAYPLGNSFFAGLKIGATVVLDSQWPTAATVADTIAQHGVTVLFSVPSLYRNVLKARLAPKLAQSLRVCVSAGEALPPSLREDWKQQTGITIANGLGASETLSLVLLNAGEGDALAPTPGVHVERCNADSDGPTRLRISGPMVALGYWNRPDAQAEHFRDGAFVPGDLFQSAGNNDWRFAGREDSLVKINGRWVDLVALEERLSLTCFGIREGAVIAAPDSDGVPAIAFYYSPKPEVEACCEDCVQRCAAALPSYQRPRWMRAVPALPRTSTGKLLRRKLLDMHVAEQDEQDAAAPLVGHA